MEQRKVILILSATKPTRPSTLTLDDYGGKAVHQKFWEVYKWLNALQFSFDFVCYFQKKNGCKTADRLLSLGNGFTRHMQTSRNDESFREAIPKR